jgi:CBS domain-containing protein
LKFALDVNQALDACGYPLCKGNVMASNPKICLGEAEWLERFSNWIEQGTPEDLLNASIYFDFRLVAGNPDLLVEMKNMVVQKAKAIPRFIKLLADNSLTRKVPISWHGGIDTIKIEDKECIDLKLHGTAILVDAARIYSLAHGIGDTNTRDRLIAVGLALGIPESEYLAWVSAFEFLQMLRLSVQIDSHPIGGNFNALELSSLNNIDRRILKESLRATRDLQQRIELDYGR